MAARRSSRSANNEQQPAGGQLVPPDDGVTVRMYRIGHGDCFLLAFAGETKPIYVLIDCGYKPGSRPNEIADLTKNIREATGGHIDIAIITHEHQDHVNGITETNFRDIAIGQTWLAWTEDPGDKVANSLRERFKDRLLGLIAARNRLAAESSPEQLKRLDDFLEFELGWDSESDDTSPVQELLAAAKDPDQSMNKKSMKLFKDRSGKEPEYIRPHEKVHTIAGAKNLRIFALGPPRDADLLEKLDPEGGESFRPVPLGARYPDSYFLAALNPDTQKQTLPFANQYAILLDQATRHEQFGVFFTNHYGEPGSAPFWGKEGERESEVAQNPDWRRINLEYSAEQLALDMNDSTNNASLVLAFELGAGGKVLLFAADAQRGNWLSWSKGDWKDGDRTVTTQDLLARTVLYKVGHHGSHNATLNGQADSEYASLGWMAHGVYGQEFTAMITAVRAWAETQAGWDHPQPEIKNALLQKASGRVFQTDTNIEQMSPPGGALAEEWEQFQSRASGNRLYFDYRITA